MKNIKQFKQNIPEKQRNNSSCKDRNSRKEEQAKSKQNKKLGGLGWRTRANKKL